LASVIQDEKLCLGDVAEQAGKVTTTVGQIQYFKEAWHPFLDCGAAVATGACARAATLFSYFAKCPTG